MTDTRAGVPISGPVCPPKQRGGIEAGLVDLAFDFDARHVGEQILLAV